MIDAANIRFNSLKHHLGYIKKFISDKPKNWRMSLLELGNLHFDVYTGKLTIEAIFSEILNILLSQAVTNDRSYFNYLGDQLSYKQLTLSDNSNWILRWGNAPEKYIHIHPARFGEHIYRIQSPALKTAIALNILENSTEDLSLEKINRVRVGLGISPINKNGMNAIVHMNELLHQ